MPEEQTLSRKPKALFLYMSIGSGHLMASRAMGEELVQLGWEASCLDPASLLFPDLLKLSSEAYFALLQTAPWLYGYLWSQEKFGEWGADMTESWPLKPILALIQAERADVIVSTQEFHCAIVGALRKKNWLRTPHAAVITDFAAGAGWPLRYVDHYLVGAEQVKGALARRGVEPERINVTGIPVAASFAQPTDQEQARRALGLADLPTLLVVAGGMMEGPYRVMVGAMKNVLRQLDVLPEPFQMLIVCGKNEELSAEVQKMMPAFRKPVHLFGFVQNLHELMSAADLIIAKPGGTITAQALVKGLPMVLVKPLPGQEGANAEFLVRQQTAVSAAETEDIAGIVGALWRDPARRRQMRERALALGRPHASRDAAQIISALVKGAR